MDKDEIEEILAVFEGYREKFPYIKDGFALTRLLDETGDGKYVNDIRKGPNGRFLNLPLVKEFIRMAGGGKLTPELFDLFTKQTEFFVHEVCDDAKSARLMRGRALFWMVYSPKTRSKIVSTCLVW